MKLYKRYKSINETYPEDCQVIWDYITMYGEPLFKRDMLEDIWRDFSDACYSAGFIEPDIDIIEHFMRWLEDDEESEWKEEND